MPAGMGGRADGVGLHYAVEIDWSEKWAESLGQALYYASETKKEPGIILLCRGPEARCLKCALRLEAAISHFNLQLTAWRSGECPITVNDRLMKQYTGKP